MRTFIILVAACLFLLPARGAYACATVANRDNSKAAPVAIAQEAAIIVWDAANQREHFIRRAEFDTAKRDIGFLVPAPTVPQLAEVDDSAFQVAADLTAPQVIRKVERKFEARWLYQLLLPQAEYETAVTGGALPAPNAAPVTVLLWQRVAGYEATVLAAENTAALGEWLKAHNYTAPPAVMQWLKPYVQKRWKITAFKIARGKDNAPLQSAAVRMSFDTPQPFYPYAEPQIQGQKAQFGRWMQLFFFAPHRVEGQFEKVGAQWPGTTKYAAALPPDNLRVFGLLGLKAPLTQPVWLTAFHDYSPLRGTKDVYFDKEKTQASLVPEPIINIVEQVIGVPVDLLLAAFFGGLFWWSKRRSKAKNATFS